MLKSLAPARVFLCWQRLAVLAELKTAILRAFQILTTVKAFRAQMYTVGLFLFFTVRRALTLTSLY